MKVSIFKEEYDIVAETTEGDKVAKGRRESASSVINKCLEFVSKHGGGTVELDKGTYYCPEYIELKNNTTLKGKGAGETKLVCTAQTTLPVFIGWTNSGSLLQRPVVRDMHIDANYKATDALKIVWCTKAKLIDLEVRNANSAGIVVAEMPDLKYHRVNEIIRCRVARCNGSGMYIGMPDITIIGGEIYECQGNGIHIAESQTKVIGTHVWGCHGTANIYIQGGFDRNSITGAVVEVGRTSTTRGYFIDYNARRTSITGGVCRGNNGEGIYLNGSPDTSITGVQIYSNALDGIVINAASANTITGNIIYDNNTSGTAGTADVRLLGGSTYNTISDNVIMAVNSKPDYGILESTASDDYNTITGNTLWGHNVATISISGANSKVRDNIGFNNINGGTATFSGDGTTTAFSIPHSLPATPTKVSVVPQSADAAGTFYVTADATNITINYSAAPPAGTNNIVLWWKAEVYT